MKRLAGKSALVTGAARGIGFGFAERYLAEGATVAIADINLSAAKEAAAALGAGAYAVQLDVSDQASIDAAIAAVVAQAGKLDILINNAAFGVPRDFFDISDDDWRLSLNVALDSCFRLSRKAAAGMAAQGWGRIIMISSVNARIGRATNTPYITAKAGLEGLARGMATELATRGVTVNCIAPGYMATDINTKFREQPGQYEWIRNRTPMKRWGAPEDLMGAAVFLASEAAAFMTGQVMVIDCGMTVAI